MSHRTSATVVLDSVTPYGDATRLTSMYVVFPKMILGERNRHRAFSLSDRSSRAVPPEKLIVEVESDPAMPAKFRRRTKGMGGGEELIGADLEWAKVEWRHAANMACAAAHRLNDYDLSKEIVNRPLDPYIRMHSLMTATRDGWLNFFGLRLDAGADPTIQVLAQRCFEAYKASEPKLLQPGQWHLPFIEENEDFNGVPYDRLVDGHLDIAIKISAARCAHLSYNDLETGKRMTVERALSIYDKLVTSRPLHASPCEHQACVDKNFDTFDGSGILIMRDFQDADQRGNFAPGWRQARKMLPGEDVAPLPDGYAL